MNSSFIYQYLNNNAPVGYEKSGQKIWLEYLKPFVDDWFTDTYGTAVAVINPKAEYKVVIEAHADEIAWYVHYITEKGYMYVARNGGSDYQIAPSMRAKMHTKKGVLPAVFGWPAIHVRKEKEKPVPDVETVVLDGGFSSRKEAQEAGVHIGTVVTFDQDLMEMNDRFWVGRALDNRIGGYLIAEVAKRIGQESKKLPFGLYIVNSVQEEVGLRGAQMIARHIKPDVAVVTDVTHDTHSPLYSKVKQGDVACGKGPVLSFAAAVHANLRDLLIEVAETHKIPKQYTTANYATGTDTDAFAYSGTGVPSALISVPLKYMHTTVEMVDKKDVENGINLFYHFLHKLEAGQSFKFFEK